MHRDDVGHNLPSANQARTFSVSRYFCRMLLGLSEMEAPDAKRAQTLRGLPLCFVAIAKIVSWNKTINTHAYLLKRYSNAI